MEERFRPERRPWDPRANPVSFVACLVVFAVIVLVIGLSGSGWAWAVGLPLAVVVPTLVVVVVTGWWLHDDEELVVDAVAVTLLRRGRVARRIDRTSPRFSVIQYDIRARSTTVPMLSFADGTSRLRLSEQLWPRSQIEHILDTIDPPEPVRAPFPSWTADRIRDFLRRIPMPREQQDELEALGDDDLTAMSEDVPGVRPPVEHYPSPKAAKAARPEHF